VVVTGRILQDLGHVVEEVTLPYDEWEALRAWITLAAADTAAVVQKLEAKYGRGRVRESLEEVVPLFGAMGRITPAELVGQARHGVLEMGRALGAFFEGYDVLVIPTMGREPARLDDVALTRTEQRALRFLSSSLGERLLRVERVRDSVIDTQLDRLVDQVMQRTMIANLTGIPAMSVPLHRTENDLPIGTQCLGRFGDEATLLRLAAQLEQAQPWRVRR
jgi:amidase